MRNLIILLVLFLASCSTTQKALNTISSKGINKPIEARQLAVLCAVHLPPNPSIIEGGEKIDSSYFKAAMEALRLEANSARAEFEYIQSVLSDNNEYNAELASFADRASRKVDSLEIALSIAKSGKMPCPKSVKVDTVFRDNPDFYICQQSLVEQKSKVSALEVEKASLLAKVQVLEDKGSANARRVRDFFFYGLIAGAVVTFLIIFFIRRK